MSNFCPDCLRKLTDVGGQWLYCPHCEAAVQRIDATQVIDPVIVEVPAEQYSLYPVSHLVSNDHPETSVQAAVKVRPKVGELEQIILDLLADHPDGLTIFQIVELSGKPYNTMSPRPKKMVDKNLIYVSSVGKSPSGNPANIYKLKGIGVSNG